MIDALSRPGNNSGLSGILEFRSKNFCENAVVATTENNIEIDLIVTIFFCVKTRVLFLFKLLLLHHEQYVWSIYYNIKLFV